MNNPGNSAEFEQGQGLGYVLVVSAVLLVLLLALVDLVVREMKAGVLTSRKSILLHATDAGVDRAINTLQVANNWKDIPKGLVPGYNADKIFTEVPGVIYRLRIQEGNWTPGYQIGDKDAERTVTVYAAQLDTGDRKKIQAVVMQSTVGSALFSNGMIAIGGSADLHWGPVVSYSTASNSIPTPNAVPIYMSAGGIGGALPDCEDPIAGICKNEYATNLGAPPIFPLAEMRQIAKGQGTYQPFPFPVGPVAGDCYSPDVSVLGKKDDDTVVFWDTADGKDFNPLTDTVCTGGASTATHHGVDVKLTGSWGGKGTLVVMGNLDTKGTNAQPVSMIPPPDCAPKYGDFAGECNNGLPKADTAMWDGLVYVAGSLSSSGNKLIYGSVYAFDTAGVTGNFSLYFKYNNKGNAFLGKTVVTKLWMERAATASEYTEGFYNSYL